MSMPLEETCIKVQWQRHFWNGQRSHECQTQNSFVQIAWLCSQSLSPACSSCGMAAAGPILQEQEAASIKIEYLPVMRSHSSLCLREYPGFNLCYLAVRNSSWLIGRMIFHHPATCKHDVRSPGNAWCFRALSGYGDHWTFVGRRSDVVLDAAE